MSGDQLDLDAIEARATRPLRGLERMPIDAADVLREDIPALVAEVRRLRAQVARSDDWLAAANAVIRSRAIDEIADLS